MSTEEAQDTADTGALAAAVIAQTFPGWTEHPQDALDREINAECLRQGAVFAQALIDAGLLPTEIEWGVFWPGRSGGVIRTSRDSAQNAYGPHWARKTRLVAPWQDAPSTTDRTTQEGTPTS